MMGLRVGVLVSLVAPSLLPWLALPLASLAAVPVVATALARPRSRARSEADSDSLLLRNPLELDVALGWAALIVGLSVLSRALQDWLGDAGLYLLAMASGLADVDAISLSLARMVPESLTPQLAAHLIVLAALANTAAKALLAAVVGGPRLALRGGGILLATLAAGAAAAFFA
jgi:uncharacterized membrane protein (DUF4010 family)